MITAHGSEKIAVEAMKAGAEDYVPKPFDNDEIRLVVQRALERTRLARDHRALLRARAARVRLREPDRIGTGHAARVRDDPQGGRDRSHRAGARRERHRQGAGRAGAPRRAARAAAARSWRSTAPRSAASWSRASCSATRRAPSPAPTRAARAASRWRTAAPSSSTRSATCRPRRRPRCCACCRSARFERVGGAKPDPGRRARRRGHAPQPRRGGRAGPLPRGPLLPAAAWSRSSCRRCASASRTCPRWRCASSSRSTERLGPREAATLGAARSRSWRASAGPATCASCATRSSKRRCWRRRALIDVADFSRRLAAPRRASRPAARRRRHGGGAFLRGQAPRRRELRARVPAARAASERRKHLAHRRVDRDGAAEPATEDPRARPALRRLERRKRMRRTPR